MQPHCTIFVVEDQIDSSTPLCGILEAEGYSCCVANTGRRAVTLARSLQPRVLLLDIQLPDISGIEALEQMRAEGSLNGCCVFAVTGHTDEATQQRCREAGVQAFFPKPMDPDELLRVVALVHEGES